ncbi:MAG TPA: hypothetical protein VGM87_26045 [Roseomonas sp.]|jgi:hypothetical protein
MRQLIAAAIVAFALSITGQAHAGLRVTADMQSPLAITALDTAGTDRHQLASAE